MLLAATAGCTPCVYLPLHDCSPMHAGQHTTQQVDIFTSVRLEHARLPMCEDFSLKNWSLTAGATPKCEVTAAAFE